MAIHGQILFNDNVPALARRGIRNILIRTIALWTEVQTCDHLIKRKGAGARFDGMIMNEMFERM
jgi:hypothetical protein